MVTRQSEPVTEGPPRAKAETDPAVLRAGVLRRLVKKIGVEGRMRMPAVPALLDEYVQNLVKMFAAYGRVFSEPEIETLKGILDGKLKEAFQISAYAHVIVRYQAEAPPKVGIQYWISTDISTLEEQYAEWVKTRTTPLFGNHADTKVLDLARSLGNPADVPVLDVGAGTGRNSLPLSRAGFPTDAVELSPDLANVLRNEASSEGLAVTLYRGNILDDTLELPKQRYRFVFLCEVVSHFREPSELRKLFERARELLQPGGIVAFNTFVPVGGYQPDQLARELSQVFWCSLFTREELKAAAAGLGFSLLSEESVYEYEKKNLPPAAWPPTGWFEDWARGLDLFRLSLGKAPVDLRWLVYRKNPEP
jgi:2-polyprenyl-3-methyl-5-hydroxy-6-metoxy-1,4-benzoquinol methylase